MKNIEAGAAMPSGPERKFNVESAMRRAGLRGVEVPREGTVAYDRLVSAAEGYMTEVKNAAIARPSSSDSENYFSDKRPISSSDTIRRQYHDDLAMMLFGNMRKQLSKIDANKLSDFAAYLTGDEEYIGSW